MDFETIIIKTEPKDEIVNADYSCLDDIECDLTQNCIKTEINSQVEYCGTNSNSEVIKSTLSFNRTNELVESCNNETIVLKSPKIEIEDIFDEENQVDISKLKYLLNENKNIDQCSKTIKPKNEVFDIDDFSSKEPTVKKEVVEEYDVSEDTAQLCDINNFALNGDFKEFLKNSDDNIDVSEVLLQSVESKFLFENENNSKTQRTFAPAQSPEDHLLNPHEQEANSIIYKCSMCSYQSKVKAYLNKHIKANHIEQKIKINCQFCDKSFTRKHSLDDHLLKKHKDEIKSNIEDFISTKIHTCDICNYETTHKTDLSLHITLMHNKEKISCQYCKKTFARKHTLQDHMLKQHQKEMNSKIYKCDHCSYQTTIKFSLRKHVISNHAERTKINCQFCDRSFALQESVDDHVLKQHEDKTCLTKSKIHKCSFCPYHTTFKSLLDRHVNSVHNEQRSKLNCHFCDKSFSYKYSLDDHLLRQHEEEIKSDINYYITNKIRTCSFCSYKTTIKTNLDVHINANHKTKKKNKCQFCDKTFSLKYSLNDHLIKHHQKKISSIKSKIYQCNVCSYHTTIKSSFKTHKLIHMEERTKLNCQFCHKLFSAKRLRDDHILKKHKGEINSNMGNLITSKIHTCNICSYQTTVKLGLDRHFKLKHK